MTKFAISFLSCYLIYFSANAQLSKFTVEFGSYIPRGWVMDTALKGDLNKDKKADVVLILRNTDKNNFKVQDGLGPDTLDLNPRRLIILFKTGSGYKKVLSTDKFLPSVNDEESTCLEDPLYNGGVQILNGVLKIHHHYWLSCGSWYVTDYNYMFRYQNNIFQLIGLDISSFHRASGESGTTSYNFSTGKKQTIDGMNEFDEKENKPVEKWQKFKTTKTYDLATMQEDTAMEEIDN